MIQLSPIIREHVRSIADEFINNEEFADLCLAFEELSFFNTDNIKLYRSQITENSLVLTPNYHEIFSDIDKFEALVPTIKKILRPVHIRNFTLLIDQPEISMVMVITSEDDKIVKQYKTIEDALNETKDGSSVFIKLPETEEVFFVFKKE